MKKFIIVAVLALGFASCSGGAEEATTPTTDSCAVACDTTACETTTCVVDSAK